MFYEFLADLHNFCEKYGYTSYKFECGITFYNYRGEPFEVSEYKQGSSIRKDWEALEADLEHFAR